MTFKHFLTVLLALLLAFAPAAQAATELQAEMNSILAYASAGKQLQAWVDELAQSHAGDADNYILALNYMGMDANTDAYAEALAKLEESNPVTRQGGALTLLSCGRRDLIPEGLADETIGKLGLMSYIYGLHLINNGLPSSLWTADSLLDILMERRLPDGGWAVTGQYANPDATAMCLHAMSCYKGNRDLSGIITETIELLSALQLDNAGYSSFGDENPESAAQVILALVACGINPLKDARFIKNGRSLLDAMLDYRLPSGGYAHLAGKGESDMAAMQVLLALASLQQKTPLYRVDYGKAPEAAENGSGWKLCAWIGIGAAALLGSGLSLIKKHGRGKRVLAVLIAAAIAAAGVYLINIESADAYYSADSSAEADGHVWLSIRCDTVAGRKQDGSTPEDGVILPRTQFAFTEGDTVFDVLTYAAKAHRLQLEHEGMSKNMAYINGINYLYEFDYGELSGWMYSVGGEYLSLGSGSLAVKDGDEIIWAYTTQLGEDLK